MRHDSSTKTSNALDPGKRGVLPEVLSERLHSVHDGGKYVKSSVKIFDIVVDSF